MDNPPGVSSRPPSAAAAAPALGRRLLPCSPRLDLVPRLRLRESGGGTLRVGPLLLRGQLLAESGRRLRRLSLRLRFGVRHCLFRRFFSQ